MLQLLTYLLHKQIIEMCRSQNLRCPFSVPSRRLWAIYYGCTFVIWTSPYYFLVDATQQTHQKVIHTLVVKDHPLRNQVASTKSCLRLHWGQPSVLNQTIQESQLDLWWLLSARFEYKLGYKPWDLLQIRSLSLVEITAYFNQWEHSNS